MKKHSRKSLTKSAADQAASCKVSRWVETRGIAGPRSMKDPRSKEYAIQTLQHLESILRSKGITEEAIRKELDEIEQNRHWEVLGYATEEAMLEAELGMRPEQMLTQARIQQAAMNTTGEVLPRGGDRKSEEAKSKSNLDIDQPSRAASNGVSRYTQIRLDRLARDYPELHKRVVSGDLSAHRAAIEAGIVKVRTPLEMIQSAYLKLSEEDRKAFDESQDNGAPDAT